MNINYHVDEKISNKIRIGDIVYNISINKIEKIDYQKLGDILESEIEEKQKKYYLIPLTENWLTKVFNFKKYYLSTKYMNVYTSKDNGFKVHQPYSNQGFTLGYRFIEKNILPYYKPSIYYINQLTSFLFLIKGEQISFDEEVLNYLNNHLNDFINV